jgi:hypothetical protein
MMKYYHILTSYISHTLFTYAIIFWQFQKYIFKYFFSGLFYAVFLTQDIVSDFFTNSSRGQAIDSYIFLASLAISFT